MKEIHTCCGRFLLKEENTDLGGYHGIFEQRDAISETLKDLCKYLKAEAAIMNLVFR